jgi:hypothetical protein
MGVIITLPNQKRQRKWTVIRIEHNLVNPSNIKKRSEGIKRA